MRKATQQSLDRLFSDSEHAGDFLSTHDPGVRHHLRYWVKTRKVVSPASGVYARKEHWESLSKRNRALLLVRSLQRLHPDWVFCGASAAVVYGLPVPNSELDVVHIFTPRDRRGKPARGIRTHLSDNDEAFEVVSGIRVATFERMLFDCMRTWDFGNALAAADAALRIGPFSRDELISRFGTIGWHYPGKNTAMTILFYADARSESPGESIARAAMIEEGFAVPFLQVEFPQVFDPSRVYRVDFFWPTVDGGYVIGEFDGFVKYVDPDCRGGRSVVRVMADERQRESQLSAYGFPILRLTYADVMNRARFVQMLTRFGIPRSDQAVADVRSTFSARRASAVLFSVFECGDIFPKQGERLVRECGM